MGLRLLLGMITLNLTTVLSVNAQKIRVYREDIGVTSRIAETNVKTIKSRDYDSFSFKCPTFFDTISEICNRLEVVPDSIVLQQNPLQNEMVKILFEGKKNQLIIYNSRFFSYNGKFYEINCELFEFYIQFFTVSRAVLSVPGSLFSQKCESALKIRWSIKPKFN